MFLVRRVYVCTTYGVRVRVDVTALAAPRRAGRYGARVPTRALRTDTRHRAAASTRAARPRVRIPCVGVPASRTPPILSRLPVIDVPGFLNFSS